jgi:predicted NodU family carbamoyl transferase
VQSCEHWDAQSTDALASTGVARLDQVVIHHVEHHRARLASAFFASPFEEAAILSIDRLAIQRRDVGFCALQAAGEIAGLNIPQSHLLLI